MRTSIVGAAFLLAGAGAATVAAVDTTGNTIALNGSDTLFDVTNAVIASCPGQFSDFASHGITYQGGGSGVGAGAMGLNTQQLSPMSRALKNTEYCSIAAPASSTLAEDLLVGIDGVSIAANPTNSCSSSAANGFGSAAAFAVTNDGTATGGAPATCPGCVGTNYTFADSFDALKVLYFGLTHDNTYSCSSPVRKSLIRNWKNLFSSDCAAGDTTCSAGLTHAWRRSDLSGTTDAFVSVLNPPNGTLTNGKGAAVTVGIGTLSTVPVGKSAKSNPFCNTSDATAAVATTSFGGGGDFQDLDPVRTNCVAGKDGVCAGFKNFATTGGSFAGDLGVVLPILLPDSASTLPADLYPATACSTACTLVAPIRGNRLASYPGYTCPGGSAPIAGNCFVPFAGSAASPDPRCVTGNATKCVDLSGRPDGRAYNLATIVASSQIPAASRGSTPFQFALDANARILSAGGFYRIHSNTAGQSYGGDANTTGICQQNDDTSQIGCLTDSDPCSVGYAGRGAAQAFAGNVTANTAVSEPLKALAVNGTPPFTPGGDPDLALKNLLQPAGTLPLYPLSRRLYLATIYGFSNLLGGESELAACYGNNNIVGPAITAKGFVAIPGGVQCLDYPETAGTGTPAPNVQGAGNVALGGCALATDSNACSVSPPSITN